MINTPSLTPAENEVLRLVMAGLRNTEIAEQRGVSRRTVESQVSVLLRKADVGGRMELREWGREIGILETPQETKL